MNEWKLTTVSVNDRVTKTKTPAEDKWAHSVSLTVNSTVVYQTLNACIPFSRKEKKNIKGNFFKALRPQRHVFSFSLMLLS